MKAEVKYTYDENEIVKAVLADHQKNYPVPMGMEWAARLDNYPSRCVVTAKTIGEKEEE